MSTHVVLGRGAIGLATARLLAADGHHVVLVSRSVGPVPDGVEHRVADAADAPVLASIARDAVAIHNCAAPPYARWATDWPPLAASVLDAAEASGAVLVSVGNLYGYGRVTGPMTEKTRVRPNGAKGALRARLWAQALALHHHGRIRVVEARGSDYLGPGVTDQGHLGARVLPRLLTGRPVRVLGDPDVPHSWTYVDDVARTLIGLAQDPSAWGRAWHVPTAPAEPAREVVQRLCRAAGVPDVQVFGVPAVAFHVAATVSPTLRELREVRHQFTQPFVLDSTAWQQHSGQQPTSLDAACAATVAWWRSRPAPVPNPELTS